MGHVRPFADADIPSVARLHEAVFKTGARAEAAGREGYHAYLRDVFLGGPSHDPSLPSLVYEEDGGHIAGFLGVMPRRLTMNRRQFQAAISSQFVVDPGSRPALVAVALAKAFLDGPQISRSRTKPTTRHGASGRRSAGRPRCCTACTGRGRSVRRDSRCRCCVNGRTCARSPRQLVRWPSPWMPWRRACRRATSIRPGQASPRWTT